MLEVKTMVSRISAKGQVTIPKEIRDQLELHASDFVAYELQDGCVLLRKLEPFDAQYHQALNATLDEWSTPEDEEAFGAL
jgi:antitoxin PrlF